MQAHTSSPYQAYIGPTMKCWLGSFSLICSVSISENCSNFFQRRRNVSTQYRWYEWVAGEVSEKLAPVSGTIHHPLLVFFCLSSRFQSVSVQLYATFLQARLVKELFEIPPEEISHVGSPFMSCGTCKCQREERVCWSLWLLLYLPISACQARHFHQGLSGSIKSLTLPNHKKVTAAERQLIEFITRFAAYWARTIKIKIYNILENKSNVGISF